MQEGYVFRVKKPSFSLFNTINRELQKVSYQTEVTSNIASDMLAFTRAPKDLTRILKHSKGISIGIPREFVGNSEVLIMEASIPREFIWIPGP